MIMQIDDLVESVPGASNPPDAVIERCTQCKTELHIPREFHEKSVKAIEYVQENIGRGDNWALVRELEGDHGGFRFSSCGNYFCNKKCDAKYNED